MKKLLFVLLLGAVWAGTSEAAGPTRGGKGSVALNYSTTVTTVTVGAGVVYSVIIASGAASEYVVLFDSATTVGLAATTNNSTLKTRCLASSTTGTTQCNYDPPLQFNNGIIAAGSAITAQSLIVYERGRVTQGY